jgi:hypothetical protein
MLDLGSSRVFNCNDKSRKLMAENPSAPPLFKLAKMHGMVVVKQVMPVDPRRAPDAPVIGTKIYIPYNRDDVYEGGRSVFLSDPHMFTVLNEVLGLQGAGIAEADLQYDLKILGIFDRLPSLDGFLMRDALELEGITADEQYFEVTDAERAAIQEFVRHKFEPLVRAACVEQASLSVKVTQLIDKIWEAKDKQALDPLIRSFRFPEDEALAIFAAWKGINFYSYEYNRTKPMREQLALWLRDKSTPTNFVSRNEGDALTSRRRRAIDRLRAHWNVVESITREYDMLYSRFLSSRDGIAAFLAFLRRSNTIYWSMGDSLSKISHAFNCWNALTTGHEERRLNADRLGSMLDCLIVVLASAVPVEKEAVWN